MYDTEGRSRHIGWWRRKVRVVHQVGERGFEAQAEAFTEMEILGETGSNGRGAGTKENADAAIPNWSRRNGIESVDIEQAAVGGDVSVANAIGALKCSALGNIQIPWIVAGTGDRREIRACFPEADCADGPSTEREIGETVHMREEFAILAYREIVDGGKQKAIATRIRHVATVDSEIEAIGDGGAVDNFGIEGGGSVAANVA